MCEHNKLVVPDSYIIEDTGELVFPTPYHTPTYEDIDVARFRCTQCGLVNYYSSEWRDFFETGVDNGRLRTKLIAKG